MSEFFSNIRVDYDAEEAKDPKEPKDPNEGLLDVNDKMKLAELFCKYTMLMIAKKNSNSGDAKALIIAAKGLSFT